MGGCEAQNSHIAGITSTCFNILQLGHDIIIIDFVYSSVPETESLGNKIL
jgi:hypothetical protein